MKLYIVRHAIADLRDAYAWPNDGERPLTKRGVKRFRRAARGLEALVPDVQEVLASPKVRAWHTALLLHEEAGWPEPQPYDELKEAPPEELRRALEPRSSLQSLALVGHEPHLSAFASLLLGIGTADAIVLRKGAVACLEVESLGWPAKARLLWLLQPRALRRLR